MLFCYRYVNLLMRSRKRQAKLKTKNCEMNDLPACAHMETKRWIKSKVAYNDLQHLNVGVS